MRATLKFGCVGLAAVVALIAGVFSAYATTPGLARAGTAAVVLPAALRRVSGAPAAACTDMQATDVAWVTLTPNHHIDKQVPGYATGSLSITPFFQYSCAPGNTTIVSVFSLNGLTVFTDKETIKARNSAGLYAYNLETLDGAPLSDGQWGVQYFNDKTLLTTGEVTVGQGGSDPTQATDATLQGVVQDQDSQAPIEGAVILILNPGVNTKAFISGGNKDSDVFTAGKSDSQGTFTLQKKLPRHQVLSMLVVVAGYKSLGSDTFQILDDPDPVSITISMPK